MSSTEIEKEANFSVEIEGEKYKVPFAVYIHIMSIRDISRHQKRLLDGWIDPTVRKPKVGKVVDVITHDNKEEKATISNGNSWYDHKRPIEYCVQYWR